jgi:hypothetical protein
MALAQQSNGVAQGLLAAGKVALPIAGHAENVPCLGESVLRRGKRLRDFDRLLSAGVRFREFRPLIISPAQLD